MAEIAYTYVIVGGGVAANAAVEGIREIDKSGSILLIGAESELPYDRPPLSKQLWKGDQKPEEIYKHDAAFYSSNGVELRLGRKATALDLEKRTVTLDDKSVCRYEQLLLATGGTPRRLAIPGGDLAGISYYRTIEDFRNLREPAVRGKSALVIGSGFIGSEMAAALCMNGLYVTMIFPGKYICAKLFPEPLAKAINKLYQDKGVQLLTEDHVTALATDGRTYQVQTQRGFQMRADLVVAGIGIVPNISLAQDAGLDLENGGVLVDHYLQTSDDNVYAAGDIATFPEPTLGRRRLEHWDAAVSQGKQAGRNMAGAAEPFSTLPFFFSDLFEFGYEAVGDIDGSLETFADWQEENKTGVIYYLKKHHVQGIMTCGIFGKVDAARQIIRDQKRVDEDDLRGAIRPE